jgi:hypothetical protein
MDVSIGRRRAGMRERGPSTVAEGAEEHKPAKQLKKQLEGQYLADIHTVD